MKHTISELAKVTGKNRNVHQPEFFRTKNADDRNRLQELLEQEKNIEVYDELTGQLQELIKGRNPTIKLKEPDYPPLVEAHLDGTDPYEYGVWVYYPWNRRLIHLLDEKEFIEVRTNRNQYKITPEEQALLSTKKIGVIGLSVGQSIALSLTMERLYGELRLADFDVLELSNMNRIRAGVQGLGLRKVVVAAREIAEIDPFLKVTLYNDGITEENIHNFFTKDGKLDVVVEVCDGLDVKILSRHKARELQIPVIMDTSDRGMIDVERFDLEPDRPILHGLAGDLEPGKMKGLTNEEKIPYIMQMIGAETISTRLKASMIEVESTITTWPQLASSVALGGAASADVCRRLLLDEFRASGRYYIDVEEIIPSDNKPAVQKVENNNPYQPLEFEHLETIAANFDYAGLHKHTPLSDEQISQLAEAARIAPSAGNNQPWKWIIRNNVFFLFHDKYRSYSWGDFNEIGSHEGLGAAIENVNLKALALGLTAHVQLYPEKGNEFFTAAISFAEGTTTDGLLLNLSGHIEKRHTNRKLGKRQPLQKSFYTGMEEVVKTIPGAEMQYVADDERLGKLGEVVSACDRVRLLYQQGHEEFFHEIRWTPWQAKETGDGIDMNLVDLTEGEKAGFKIAVDWNAISLIEQWDKGRAFQKMSRKSIAAASGMVLITMPAFDKVNFINTGRAVDRAWIYANANNVALHPMLSPVFFFNMLRYGSQDSMTERMRNELQTVRKEYEKIFDFNEGRAETFLFKVAIADPIHDKTYRLPMDKVVKVIE